MVKTIKKRVFGNNCGFTVKEDPNTWTESDIDHLARVLIRVSKKSPIKMITYNGVGSQYNMRIGKNIHKRPSHETWGNKFIDGEYGSFMDFDVQYEIKCSKTSRKTNLEDIKMLLIMEVL